MDVTDIAHGLEKAVYDRLKAQITNVPVFQHVPQDTAPPVIMIAAMNRTDASGKTGQVEYVEFEIVCIFRSHARAPVHAAQQRVKDALHEFKPAVTGGTMIHKITQLDASDQLMADGLHYYGNQRFRTWIEPA